MSARDHTRIEELLAVDALGGLEAADEAALRAEMAEHGPDCETCRRLETGFRETAAMLALSLDPAPVRPGTADRVLAAAKVPRPEEAAPATPRHAAADRPADLDTERTRRRAAPWRAVIGVAAALAVLFAGVALIRGGGPSDVTTNWAQTVRAFEGEGELAMAYAPGSPGVVLWGEGLPDPGAGHTLEIWMIEDDVPVSGGCVTPVDGKVAVFVDADVDSAEQMAVTIEPDTCPSAPTGEPIQTLSLV